MFKMGCSMARKILPGTSSSGGGSGADAAGQQAACFSLGSQPGGKSSGGGRAGENHNNSQAAASPQNQEGGGGQPTKRVANSSALDDFSKLEDDPRIPLNVRQIFKITKSWKAIARTMSKTGTAMFLNLFEQNQDLFYLFDRFQHLKGKELHESMELREHAATVMSTLDTSINSLSDYDNFVTYLHSIGELHRKVPGFKREYFWKIEQPFMKAVKQTLDERCNETIEEIYKIAIKLIIETIADGYGQDGNGGGGGPLVTSNERHDDGGDGGANNGAGGRGSGGTQPGGNNNNKFGDGGGGKSGSAMAPCEPSGAAGGQQRGRQHKVRQTKTTNACTAPADDFTQDISKEKLNSFVCPASLNSTGHTGNNGHYGRSIISESQSHEKEDKDKGDNNNNNNNNNNNINKKKCLRVSRMSCFVRRNQIVAKTKRVVQHMQSLVISTLEKATIRTPGKHNADFKDHNQNLINIHRPQDQDAEQEDNNNLENLVLSTCKLLKTTSKLIEERVQSQCERRDTKTEGLGGGPGESRGEDDAELAKLIKWRGLLAELTDSSGVGSLTTVTGDVQDSPMMAFESVQIHPSAHNREKFNIKSGTGPSVRVVVPTGANDNGTPLELRREPEEDVTRRVCEPAEQNYNLPLPHPATAPIASDLLAMASRVTDESRLGISGSSGSKRTPAKDESIRGASNQSIRLAHPCCPHNVVAALVQGGTIVRSAAECTAASATCTNITRGLASVEDHAVLREQPDADAIDTQTNELYNGGRTDSTDVIDFIKLLLMINNLILASNSLTDRASSTIPHPNLTTTTLTTICPQISV